MLRLSCVLCWALALTEASLRTTLMAGKTAPGLTMYDDHVVLRLAPKDGNATMAAANALEALQVKGADLDVWKIAMRQIDVRVSPAEKARVIAMGHPFTVMNDDLGGTVRANYRKVLTKENSSAPADFFDNYADLDELLGFYKGLAQQYPDLVKYVPSIGKTHEGRDIPAFHLKGKNYRGDKKFYFEGLIHAREWISGMTVAYVTNELLTNYASDPSMLDEVEFVIVPVVNPDGYDFTWTNTRLWRKNRAPSPRGSSCVGVDLNRNWGNHWSGPGASSNPCSDTYYGTSSFSEPETKSASDYILKEGPFSVGIDFHAYSQIVMRPWGWTLPSYRGGIDPPGAKELQEAAEGMSAAIMQVHNQYYVPEPAAELYVASGGADDWMFDDGKCAKAFTFELRDTGRYGFVLPANQIVPTGEEIWNSIKYLVQRETAVAKN
jgi:murein tripeptide amidase MpaA